MNILITGSSGFLGSNLTKIKSDNNLLTPLRNELNLLRLDDIIDYLKSKNIDAIVHLAAECGGIGISSANPGKFIYTNLQMGINILEAARAFKISKVINIGTVCSYPKFTKIPFTENTLWDGYPEETNAPYGIAKKTVMEMAKFYSIQYGMDITNLIPVNMCGLYDNYKVESSHVIPAMINKFELNKDKVVLWGTGTASREFLDARDCSRAIMIALGVNTGYNPINLGTGNEITISTLANLIKIIGNYTADIIWDSSKPDGQPKRCLDVTRAKKILGWESEIKLIDSIRDSINFYRQYKK